MSERPKVLVKEKIAEAGVDLLRESFDVEVGTDWPEGELESPDRRVRRDPDPLGDEDDPGADRQGRPACARSAVPAPESTTSTSRPRPKRGIIVANAPESNSVAAAEHTLALALALFRNVPQAHATLADGEWARSRFGGNELYRKTLGVIGFGRIGQLVARRALAFDMDVDRLRQVRLRRALPASSASRGSTTSTSSTRRADLITIHLPKTPETINWIDAEACAKMKDGVRIVNCARGELIDLEALEAGRSRAARSAAPRSTSSRPSR